MRTRRSNDLMLRDRRRRHRRRRPRGPVLRAEARAAPGDHRHRRADRRRRVHAPGRRAASPRRSPKATRRKRMRATPSRPAPASSTRRSRTRWRARRRSASATCSRYGVPFDRDLEGQLPVGREAAHSARRIVHVRGDRPGAPSWRRWSRRCARRRRIRVLEGYVAEDLLTAGRHGHRPRSARQTDGPLADAFRRAPSCWPPAASGISMPSPPIRAKRAATASRSRRAPAR